MARKPLMHNYVYFETLEVGSDQTWRELLVDIKQRRFEIAPALAVGDGALGFWKVIEEVFPGTRRQRCWVHIGAHFPSRASRCQFGSLGSGVAGQLVASKQTRHVASLPVRRHGQCSGPTERECIGTVIAVRTDITCRPRQWTRPHADNAEFVSIQSRSPTSGSLPVGPDSVIFCPDSLIICPARKRQSALIRYDLALSPRRAIVNPTIGAARPLVPANSPILQCGNLRSALPPTVTEYSSPSLGGIPGQRISRPSIRAGNSGPPSHSPHATKTSPRRATCPSSEIWPGRTRFDIGFVAMPLKYIR